MPTSFPAIIINAVLAALAFIFIKWLLEAVFGLVGVVTLLLAILVAAAVFFGDVYGRYQNRT